MRSPFPHPSPNLTAPSPHPPPFRYTCDWEALKPSISPLYLHEMRGTMDTMADNAFSAFPASVAPMYRMVSHPLPSQVYA
jgi:hypothetical protein